MVYVKSLQLSSDKERPKTSRESDQKMFLKLDRNSSKNTQNNEIVNKNDQNNNSRQKLLQNQNNQRAIERQR